MTWRSVSPCKHLEAPTLLSAASRQISASICFVWLLAGFSSAGVAGEVARLDGGGTRNPSSGVATSASRAPSASQQEIRELLRRGEFERAATLARKQIASLEARGRKNTLEALRFQDLLVEALWRGPGLMAPESLLLSEQTLLAKERLCRPDDPEIAASLDNLAYMLRLRDQKKRARDLFERSLAIRESARGVADLRLVGTLVGLSDVVSYLGEIPLGRKLAERAYQIASSQKTPPEAELQQSLIGLGSTLFFAGLYEESREKLWDAVRRTERIYGPDHPVLGEPLTKLGNTLAALGAYEEARSAFERAVHVAENGYGPADIRLVTILGNYGVSCWRAGDYNEAKEHMERGLRIMDAMREGRTQRRASQLVNLGMVSRAMGDWPKAIASYESGLGIFEEVLGPEHPSVGNALNNLGNLYSDMGEFRKSRDYFERVLSIWQKAYPLGHPLIFVAQSNLARQLQQLGEYDRARLLQLRTLASQQKSLGPDHPEVAETLENLGELYEAMGDLPMARERFELALRAREKYFGPRHRKVAKSLNNLARTEIAAGRPLPALELALRAESIAREEFKATSKALSESEALFYEQIRISGLGVALSVLASPEHGSSQGMEVKRVWEELIRSRAKVLDELAARHRSVVDDESPEIRSLVEDLTGARSRLSHLLVSGPDPKNPEGYAAGVAAVEEERQKAERALAARSASFREQITEPASWMEALRAALPSDGALLAYVSFQLRKPLAMGASVEQVYGVLVLTPREPSARFLMLGSAEDIDRKVFAWRTAVDLFRSQTPLARGSPENLSLDEGRDLRKAIWDPVVPRLRGVRRVFIVPDGTLNLVNLAALPGDDARYLVETAPLIHYLSTERDLALPPKPFAARKELLAFGGPDFDLAPGSGADVPSSPVAGFPAISSSPWFRGAPPTCGEFLKLRFNPLPEAMSEVSEIKATFEGSSRTGGKAQTNLILTGGDASEKNFKRLSSSRPILHLATHGFLLGDCDANPSASSAGDAGNNLKDSGAQPLLVAGLALAGANRRSEAGPTEEDGVLTAEEIASLDLSGVDWAVLSACETGIGRIQAGEGVLGLRRAFQVAGARTLIMSLWKVEDGPTRSWMYQLYRARLAGSSTAEAVRSASLSVLKARRAKGQSTNPFYWGAFVAAGDWR